MSDRRARARDLVTAALQKVERELAQPTCGLHPDQLCTCAETLRGYLEALEGGGALPPKREREEALGRLVLDACPFDHPLANAILQAERAFRTA